ncbi:hypothetical protein HD595_000900 [Nonomuraea roseoviolacea subsp. carminata]|uniref:Uncharacterized protein n=1 Tax=Nonomuraea roseoviolacea subsp. carminata TaxID=160689 RepID=A0ABT1JSQ2_9ACTN|nr:hypothetical protein [Nonomuraea roseoviolacea subsp. carminata]
MTFSPCLEARDSHLRRSGFLLHRRPHPGGPGVSDVTSAGSHGKTCRQDVLRGVEVPVVPGAAGRALPRPDAERKPLKQVPAGRAGLGAGQPAVDHDQVTPVPGRLVGEHAAEGAPSAVGDGLGQCAVADHVGHGQVLDHDHVVVADQPRAGLVQEVRAGRAYLPVGAGDLGLRLAVVARPLDLACSAALVAGQVALPLGQMARVGDLVAVGGDGEVRHAEIHGDHGARRREPVGNGDIGGEGDVPPSARVPGDGHRGRVDGRRVHLGPGPDECQGRVHLREEQSPVSVAEPRAGVFGRLPSGSGLVARMSGASGEEVRERRLLVPDRLLQRHRRHLVQPCQLVGGLHRGEVGVRLDKADLRLLGAVSVAPPGQGAVPDDAYAPERAIQRTGLLRRRVRPALVRRPHRSILTNHPLRNQPLRTKHVRGGARPSCPGPKPGVSSTKEFR